MGARYRLIAPQDLDATLIDAWRAIQAESRAWESPYFSPEFTQLVARVRDDVRIVVIEDAGRPVGFFPHQRSWLGSGKPVAGPLSDYHGVIADPRSEWCASELLRAADLAVFAFDHLVDPSQNFDAHVTARATSPQMDLRAGFEQYLRTRSDPPSDFARKARKLAREVGALHFSLHDTDSDSLQHMFRWKSEQYRRSGVVDGFRFRWTRELLREVTSTQTAEFAGVCSVLRAGDQIVAVHAGMRSRDVLHWWFPAYDPRHAKFSPGIILLMRIAEALPGLGVGTIDLGKGDDRYKSGLMTHARDLSEGWVERPSLRALARRLRRAAEGAATRGGVASALRLPLKAVRRLEVIRRFR